MICAPVDHWDEVCGLLLSSLLLFLANSKRLEIYMRPVYQGARTITHWPSGNLLPVLLIPCPQPAPHILKTRLSTMTPIPPAKNALVHSVTVAVILGTIVGAVVGAGLVACVFRIFLARSSASLRCSLSEAQAQMTVMVQTMVSVSTASVSCRLMSRRGRKASVSLMVV